MKTFRIFTLSFLFVAIASTSYSQGNKVTFPVVMEWNQSLVPISCIGEYSGLITMNMTFFKSGREIFDGKVLNKASGEITAGDKIYTIKSVFNCNLFSARTSASALSIQTMTFRVRSKETGKIVATIHTTWHYDMNGIEDNPYLVNAQTVCHY